jgi:hypothetical protein
VFLAVQFAGWTEAATSNGYEPTEVPQIVLHLECF